jgi:hypothetical protein
MAVLTSQIARQIIETAKLPKRPARARREAKPPAKLKSTDAQALVVGSSLVVAAENVPARVRSSGTTLEAHKSVINVLSTLLGPSAAAVVLVTDTLKALQSMNENSSWITLFDHQSVAVSSARFQVAAAQMGAGGLIEVALVAFELHSKVSLTQVLFFKFKANSTKLRYARGNATIYEAVLRRNRKLVAERLEAYQTAYVGEVRFPPTPAAG